MPAMTSSQTLDNLIKDARFAAIFSVVEATLLRTLPFAQPERLAFMWGVAGPERAIRGASYIETQDWRPNDIVVFTMVPALLLLVALFASWLPARRAAALDPQMTLRAE